MAWVRYDDQFHSNPKITAVIAEDPGALALHVLANTWTNGQKRMGYIPAHQPGVLVCDRTLGKAWAALMVKHGLWHEWNDVGMCSACCEDYDDLPDDLDGYVVHNSKEYRAPERDRTKPGTPSELSEKRREAGRRGGKAAAVRREQAQQDARANGANGVSIDSKLPFAGVSKTSNLPLAGVSPEPVPEPSDEPSVHHVTSEIAARSSDADDPDDEAPGDREDVERLCVHLADRVEGNGSKRPRITGRWRDSARLLIDKDGRTEQQVRTCIDWCQDDEFWRPNIMSMPKLREKYDQLRLAADAKRRAAGGRDSPNGKYAPGSGSDLPPRDSYKPENFI